MFCYTKVKVSNGLVCWIFTDGIHPQNQDSDQEAGHGHPTTPLGDPGSLFIHHPPAL